MYIAGKQGRWGEISNYPPPKHIYICASLNTKTNYAKQIYLRTILQHIWSLKYTGHITSNPIVFLGENISLDSWIAKGATIRYIGGLEFVPGHFCFTREIESFILCTSGYRL